MEPSSIVFAPHLSTDAHTYTCIRGHEPFPAATSPQKSLVPTPKMRNANIHEDFKGGMKWVSLQSRGHHHFYDVSLRTQITSFSLYCIYYFPFLQCII